MDVHDLMPLHLAALVVFKRVYEKRSTTRTLGRLDAHLDGLAYAIGELAPLYVLNPDGASARPLAKKELDGGLFQDGARCLSFIDGRPAISNLAISAKAIGPVIDALLAGFEESSRETC
jgi:hypothetical protein